MATQFLPRRLLAIPAALLCLGAASARADVLPSLAWNCWAGGQNPAQVSCVHRRGPLPLPLSQTALEDPDSELEAQVLGQLLEKKRSMGTATVEGVEWRNIDVLHKGARWTVKVHSYPQGVLGEEGRFNKLVKAVLCPTDTPCTVTFRNQAQPGIGEAR